MSTICRTPHVYDDPLAGPHAHTQYDGEGNICAWKCDYPCRHCGSFMIATPCGECDDGEIDLYEEDPINFDMGDFGPCRNCGGRSYTTHCPACSDAYCWEYRRTHPKWGNLLLEGAD